MGSTAEPFGEPRWPAALGRRDQTIPSALSDRFQDSTAVGRALFAPEMTRSSSHTNRQPLEPLTLETDMKTVSISARVSAGIAATIFGALALCGSRVSAADGAMPEAVVTYSDLDLSNPRDARELYGRITAAANKVCLSYPVDGRSLVVHAWLRECAHHAVADAVIRIDQPALFAIYNSKNRSPVTNEVATVRAR